MIVMLDNGAQIRGDLMRSAVFRSDLSPVPCSLEVEVKAGDDDFVKRLGQGRTISLASGEVFSIIKSEICTFPAAQGDKEFSGLRITAILDGVKDIAYVRNRAIIVENTTLASIYRAAGSRVRGIVNDFPVPRFSCFIGDTPSFHIAQILQEEGGVVRWKNGRLEFMRLIDMMNQKPFRQFSEAGRTESEGGFIERHAIPWFFSIADNASIVFGNRQKPRSVRFSPFKNTQRLHNMSRALVRKKTLKVLLDVRISAGDIIALPGNQRFAVITAAHVFQSGMDNGGQQETYTKLWLGAVES